MLAGIQKHHHYAGRCFQRSRRRSVVRTVRRLGVIGETFRRFSAWARTGQRRRYLPLSGEEVGRLDDETDGG